MQCNCLSLWNSIFKKVGASMCQWVIVKSNPGTQVLSKYLFSPSPLFLSLSLIKVFYSFFMCIIISPSLVCMLTFDPLILQDEMIPLRTEILA